MKFTNRFKLLSLLLLLIIFLCMISGCGGGGSSSSTATDSGTFPEDVETNGKLQIERHGITWTFDGEYTHGQFINGDYYVIGPAVLESISPEPASGKNGSVINPVTGGVHGYDDRVSGYDMNLVIQAPVTLKPGESLVSTVSLRESDFTDGRVTDVLHRNISSNHAYVKSAAVLTCLATPPPDDAFRPPYVGTDKPIYTKSQIRYELLPSLPPVNKEPGTSGYNSYIEYNLRVYERVWLNHKTDWSCRLIHPVENMPNYHREIANFQGEAALILMLDIDENSKHELLERYLQVGIDTYHMSILGHGDSAFNKWPVLFTGIMLDEPDIYNVFNEGRCEYPEGSREDRMTYI